MKQADITHEPAHGKEISAPINRSLAVVWEKHLSFLKVKLSPFFRLMKAIFQPMIVMACCFAGSVEAATTAADLEQAIKRGDTLEQIVALFDEGPEVNYKVNPVAGQGTGTSHLRTGR